MEMFKEKPVTEHAIVRRKPLYGLGINDADYVVTYKGSNGKNLVCPFYRRWTAMITRCYSNSFLIVNPTYKGCTVCDEWLVFSAFRKWMQSQNWGDKELDKDLIVEGNKIYSPDNCMFVSSELNTLMCSNASSRGKYPKGVSWHSQANKFRATFTCSGEHKYLGLHVSIGEAETAYKLAKANHIADIINNLDDTEDVRLKPALLRISNQLRK